MFRLIVFAVCFGLFLYVLWQALKPRWDIHIAVRHNSIELRKGNAIARRSDLTRFLENDMTLPERTEILVRWEKNGRLVTRFKGEIDVVSQQRIRNFLLNLD